MINKNNLSICSQTQSYFDDEVSCRLIRSGAVDSVMSIQVALKSKLVFQMLLFCPSALVLW